MKIEPYYDRTDLINVTRETVNENLTFGMVLVTVILLMFLSNVRTALIVAINIPLALLFAFAVLYLRGKSANLLSIGAVDFGIIVDSSVIMVENIYRHLSSGEHAELPLRQRIIRAAGEVERSLFFSTLIMVCALLPLFTMQGPEGQISARWPTPMPSPWAARCCWRDAVARAVHAVAQERQADRDNFLVRSLKRMAVGFVDSLPAASHRVSGDRWASGALPRWGRRHFLGHEFMPELEEGNLWIRGTFPVSTSLDEMHEKVKIVRSIMRKYAEVESIVAEIGRPDDGTDPTGFYNAEFFVPLEAVKDWPAVEGDSRAGSPGSSPSEPGPRTNWSKEMNDELNETLIGVDWNFSQNIRDNVMEALSGVKGDNSVKIIGPELDELERLADETKKRAATRFHGMDDVGVFHIKGQPNLEFPIDRAKCARWA